MKRIVACLIAGVLLSGCITSADDKKEELFPSPLVLTELKVTLSHASIFLGQTTTALATGTDQFANPIATGAVTYSSSSPAATITQDGFITTVATGNVIITATTATKHAETLLTIAAPTALATMQLTLPNSSVRLGQSASIAFVAKDQYGAVFTPSNVVWTSSTPSVATVSQSGLVTGVTLGQSTITVASQGVTATLAISVIPDNSATLSVSLVGESRVKVGDPYAYTPTIAMLDGTVTHTPFTFSVSPANAASITPEGLVTPLTVGSIVINTIVNGVAYPTTISAYDWNAGSSSAFTSTSLASDSIITESGAVVSPGLQYLSVSCSTLTDPTKPEFNVGVYVTPLLGASSSVHYTVDATQPRNEMWPGPVTLPGLISYPYPSSSTDRVAFVRALASGKSLRFTFNQTLQGPITMTFRLTGMSAATSAALSACGVN